MLNLREFISNNILTSYKLIITTNNDLQHGNINLLKRILSPEHKKNIHFIFGVDVSANLSDEGFLWPIFCIPYLCGFSSLSLSVLSSGHEKLNIIPEE